MRKIWRAIVILAVLNLVTYVAIRRFRLANETSLEVPPLRLNLIFKRLFDLAVSSIALFMLAPVFMFIALGVRCTSNGPIFYKATRSGRNAKPFKLYKFRTMVVNADKMGPGVTGHNDSRVTVIGRILRKTKLDELPQLLNVLKGEMSLVGPRPEDPRFVKMYTPEQIRVLTVKPGITSPASVQFRNEEAILSGPDWETKYIKEVMPTKLHIDLGYVKNPNVLSDLKILVQTVQAVLN